MGKNLYKATVELEFEIMITADEPPTHNDILEAAEEEMRENGTSLEVFGNPIHVTELRQLPKDWEGAQPYGDNQDGRTCRQILDAYVPDHGPLGEQTTLDA